MWHRVDVDEVHELYPPERCSAPSCDALVRRVFTLAGKRIPLDVDPVPDAAAVVRRDDAGDVRVHILAGGDHRGADEVTWRQHERSCTSGETARRLRSIRTPRCHGCTEPLDAVIAAAAGDDWPSRWHATCAPAVAPRPAAPTHEQQELLCPSTSCSRRRARAPATTSCCAAAGTSTGQRSARARAASPATDTDPSSATRPASSSRAAGRCCRPSTPVRTGCTT